MEYAARFIHSDVAMRRSLNFLVECGFGIHLIHSADCRLTPIRRGFTDTCTAGTDVRAKTREIIQVFCHTLRSWKFDDRASGFNRAVE